MPRIVTLNVTQTEAPAPILLQQTGFVTAMDTTTLAAGKAGLLTQLSDLAIYLAAPGGSITITNISWAANVTTVTYVGAAPTVGSVVSISGCGIDVYNGSWVVATSASGTFTFALAAPANPGVPTTFGVWSAGNSTELTAMVTTFFAQGNSVGVYLFETGSDVPALSIAEMSTYITNNPFQVYTVTCPRSWDGAETLLSLIASDEALTAKIYFLVTTTLATYTDYTALMKDVVAMVEAPTTEVLPNGSIGVLRPSTEFSIAAFMQVILRQQPSAANQVCPFCFSFLFGVTPYPILGNNALLDVLAAAAINFVWTGAEGGISTALIYPGETLDGNDFLYWYSVDWVELNIDEDLSNAVINGSNNPQAPLYFNQPGINSLQDVAQQTMADAIAFGLALGPITVTAIPFAQYVLQNPQQFEDEEYGGLAVVYTPNKGFRSILFNANISQLPAAT